MEKKEMIYRLLCAGKYASEIARELHIDKAYISREIKKLEQAGLVQCIDKKSYPKVYEKTQKNPSPYKLTSISPIKLTRLLGRSETVEIQKTSFKYNITSVADIKRSWDKKVDLKHGVTRFLYKYPFENIGEVVFDYYHSKNKDILLIILPRMLVSRQDIEDKGAEYILLDYAMKSGAWYQKKFKMRLGLPEICQKPHYAVPLREPFLIDAVHKGTYKKGEIMLDMSPPDRIPEFESTRPEDVIDYLDLPNLVKQLTFRMDMVEKNLVEISGVCAGLVKNQERIADTISGVKPIPDDKIDVV